MIAKKIKVLSPKLISPAFGIIGHWCPGCNIIHHITLRDDNPKRDIKTRNKIPEWNLDALLPTINLEQVSNFNKINSFDDTQKIILKPITKEEISKIIHTAAPDISTIELPNTKGFDVTNIKCHYSLTNGKLYYFPDTTHQYSNQTIDLPDIPQNIIDDLNNPKPFDYKEYISNFYKTSKDSNE